MQHRVNFNSKLQVVISVLTQLVKLSYTIYGKLDSMSGLCIECVISFGNGKAQGEHGRNPWKKVRVSFVTKRKLGLLYQTLIVEVVVLHQIQAR